jgi:hypothetical protein
MTGHIFVTQANLLRLHCDAWLLPSDALLGVTPSFRGDGSAEWVRDVTRLQRGERPLPAGWGNEGVRVIPLGDGQSNPPSPCPFLVNVGGWEDTPIDWYMEGVRQFCGSVAAVGARVTGRPRPLVALPLVGTGAGGAVTQKGDIIRALLETLYASAAIDMVDFVVVTRDTMAHAAVQHVRHQLAAEATAPAVWSALDARLIALADDLARKARAGHLVLFLGAGVSMGAGLPSWNTLLERLARDAGLDDDQREALGDIHPADRARIVEMRLLEQGENLGARVCALVAAERYALAHSLLAALPVAEVVTLNYDRLFEYASEDADRQVAVLPYQPSMETDRWLLKMHGCVRHPRDIVLTREDYLRYADRRAALAGIVQALLITRHMLFVGFSLTDDNFQRIVDDVRKALGGEDMAARAAHHFGTALTLDHKPLLEELWRDSVRPVAMVVAGEAALPPMETARRLDILLDRVLAEATRGTVPLLDERYDGILTDQERAIRVLLERLRGDSEYVREAPAWQPIARLLQQLGA